MQGHKHKQHKIKTEVKEHANNDLSSDAHTQEGTQRRQNWQELRRKPNIYAVTAGC